MIDLRTVLSVAALGCLAAAAGCAPTDAAHEPSQLITGRVALSDYQQDVRSVRVMQGELEVSMSALDGQGNFSLEVPAGEGYALQLVGEHDVLPVLVGLDHVGDFLAFRVCAPTGAYDVGAIRPLSHLAQGAYPEHPLENFGCAPVGEADIADTLARPENTITLLASNYVAPGTCRQRFENAGYISELRPNRLVTGNTSRLDAELLTQSGEAREAGNDALADELYLQAVDSAEVLANEAADAMEELCENECNGQVNSRWVRQAQISSSWGRITYFPVFMAYHSCRLPPPPPPVPEPSNCPAGYFDCGDFCAEPYPGRDPWDDPWDTGGECY